MKRVSAADEVFAALRGRIQNGELVRGECLPSQDELARQFAVSRNTIREAVTRLSALGLVDARQGVGTIVMGEAKTDLLPWSGEDLLLSPAAVSDFLEARLFVERSTIRLVVMRANASDLKRLSVMVAAQQEAVAAGDYQRFGELDVEYHMAMAAISGNQVLNTFFQAIWSRLHDFIAQVSRMEGIVEESAKAHARLIERIVARDVAGAERCLTEHLYRTGQGIERNTGQKLGLEAFVDYLHQPGAAS